MGREKPSAHKHSEWPRYYIESVVEARAFNIKRMVRERRDRYRHIQRELKDSGYLESDHI